MTKQFMRDQLEKEFQVKPKESLVERLRKRALIRRAIPRNEPDRIAELLEEAANEIDRLNKPYKPPNLCGFEYN